jgi:hypothetical protein
MPNSVKKTIINIIKSLLSGKTIQISHRWLAVRNDAAFRVFGSGGTWWRLRRHQVPPQRHNTLSFRTASQR